MTADALAAAAAEAGRRGAEVEQARRLPPDLVETLVGAGAFRLWVPADYGGAEVGVDELLDAIEAFAYHDGSTGWCVMIANTTALSAARLAPEHARALYGDPAAITGGYAQPVGRAVAVDGGGIRVSGRWSWGSGSSHCTSIGGGVLVVDEAGEPAALADGSRAPFAYFDLDDVTLLDTWHVAGLEGTASTDYEVHDAYVPEGRWVDWSRPTALHVDGAIYRLPFFGTLAAGVAAVVLGLGQRAIDELVALGPKHPMGSSRTLAERPAVQGQVAEAEAAVRSARAFLREAMAAAEAELAAGAEEASGEARRLLRMAATTAAVRGAEAVDLCYHAGGGSAVYRTSPLQRVFRDVHVATQHGMVAPRTLEPLGRMAFGLPTDLRTI